MGRGWRCSRAYRLKERPRGNRLCPSRAVLTPGPRESRVPFLALMTLVGIAPQYRRRRHFRLSLLGNGDATLVERWGRQPARRCRLDLGKLNHLIEQSGFERMVPRYQTGWSDQQTVTIAITTKDENISVADYGGAAPIEFWAIQQALEAISHRIRWKAK